MGFTPVGLRFGIVTW